MEDVQRAKRPEILFLFSRLFYPPIERNCPQSIPRIKIGHFYFWRGHFFCGSKERKKKGGRGCYFADLIIMTVKDL